MVTPDNGSNPNSATQRRPSDRVERDAKVPGLMLRHRATRSSWHLYYRTKDGRERRPKIGDATAIPRAKARDIARQWLGVVAGGGDPAIARDRRMVAELAERFSDVHAAKRKPKTAEMYRIAWAHALPALGRLDVAGVTRKEIADLHHRMRGKPAMANRTLAVLHKAFNLSEVWGWRPAHSNPVHGIDRYGEKKRRRYPSPEEAGRIMAALDKFDHGVFADFVRLVMMTGCRPSEIRTARREWVLDGGLHLPDSKGGERIIALPRAALDVIAGIPTIKGNPYLVPGRLEGQHLVGVGKLWRRLMREAKVEGLQLRDLRRYFASLGLSAGLSLEAVGQLLGHQTTQTTKTYAYLMQGARQAAVEAVARRLPSPSSGRRTTSTSRSRSSKEPC